MHERRPVRINSDTIKPLAPSDASFVKRWRHDGVTRTTESHVRVWNRCHPSQTAACPKGAIHDACLGHELGHAALTSCLPLSALKELPKFQVEVDAWSRWKDTLDRFIDATEAYFILDALNSYRRGLHTPEAEWDRARQLVISWTEPRLRPMVATYVPLEPEPGEPMPECGGDQGDAPDGPDKDNGDEPYPDSPPSGGGEGNGNEGEGDEGDSEGDEGDSDGKGRRSPDEGKRGSHADRDEWLATPEGMWATEYGQLGTELEERGWDMNDLPPLTKAILDRTD